MAFSPILLVTMNRSSLYRLIKPMICKQDASLSGTLKRYHSGLFRPCIPDVQDDDFSIIDPYVIRELDTNENASYEILGSGVILLKNYLSLVAQVYIVNTCEKLGLGPGGFYQPRKLNGQLFKFQMMRLGRNWEPVPGEAKSCPSDGYKPPPLPLQFFDLAKCAIKDAQVHLHELPSMCPDAGVVNFYPPGGPRGPHEDFYDDSSDSLSGPLPVVSMSLGNSAELWYGDIRDVEKMDKVMLEGGDVLIFGGKSTLIFYGVKETKQSTCSPQLQYATRLKQGRLNLVLRKL